MGTFGNCLQEFGWWWGIGFRSGWIHGSSFQEANGLAQHVTCGEKPNRRTTEIRSVLLYDWLMENANKRVRNGRDIRMTTEAIRQASETSTIRGKAYSVMVEMAGFCWESDVVFCEWMARRVDGTLRLLKDGNGKARLASLSRSRLTCSLRQNQRRRWLTRRYCPSRQRGRFGFCHRRWRDGTSAVRPSSGRRLNQTPESPGQSERV